MNSKYVSPQASCNGGLLMGEYGLTKRELFAAMAMQGSLSNSAWLHAASAGAEVNKINANTFMAGAWVQYADALIEELEKERE